MKGQMERVTEVKMPGMKSVRAGPMPRMKFRYKVILFYNSINT
jgi:hypothetical protein